MIIAESVLTRRVATENGDQLESFGPEIDKALSVNPVHLVEV
jgi:hypothetical protein